MFVPRGVVSFPVSLRKKETTGNLKALNAYLICGSCFIGVDNWGGLHFFLSIWFKATIIIPKQFYRKGREVQDHIITINNNPNIFSIH